MTEIDMLTISNHAEIQNGNLYGLGLGWNWCYRPVPACDLVLRTLVAPGRLESAELSWHATLVDGDGQGVPGPERVGFEYHASGTMPDGLYPGTEVPMWTIFHFPSFDLEPGRYAWQVNVDDQVRLYPFTVVNRPES